MLYSSLDCVLRLPILLILDHLGDLHDNFITADIFPCLHNVRFFKLPLSLSVILYLIYCLFRPLSFILRLYTRVILIVTALLLNSTISLLQTSHNESRLRYTTYIFAFPLIYVLCSFLEYRRSKLAVIFCYTSLYAFMLAGNVPSLLFGLLALIPLIICLFEGVKFLPIRSMISEVTSINLDGMPTFSIILNFNSLRLYGFIFCVIPPLINHFTCNSVLDAVLGEFSYSYVRIICLSSYFSYFGRVLVFILSHFHIESDVYFILDFIYAIFVIWMSLVIGLPNYELLERADILRKNFWLALLNSLFLVHEIVKRHIKDNGGFQNLPGSMPLVSSIMVILGSTLIGIYMFFTRVVDAWLFTVILLVTENNISAFCCLLLYLYYKFSQNSETENAGNFEFIVVLAGESVNFLLGVMMIITSIYTYYLKGRFFRLLTVLLHVYVNIYMKWKEIYDLVRSHIWIHMAIGKLPMASQDQLDNRSNICSICIDDLECKDSCYLHCTHVFHVDCLRKWAAVKELCPVCLGPLILTNR